MCHWFKSWSCLEPCGTEDGDRAEPTPYSQVGNETFSIQWVHQLCLAELKANQLLLAKRIIPKSQYLSIFQVCIVPSAKVWFHVNVAPGFITAQWQVGTRKYWAPELYEKKWPYRGGLDGSKIGSLFYGHGDGVWILRWWVVSIETKLGSWAKWLCLLTTLMQNNIHISCLWHSLSICRYESGGHSIGVLFLLRIQDSMCLCVGVYIYTVYIDDSKFKPWTQA